MTRKAIDYALAAGVFFNLNFFFWILLNFITQKEIVWANFSSRLADGICHRTVKAGFPTSSGGAW
jgi:hypothetical protein